MDAVFLYSLTACDMRLNNFTFENESLGRDTFGNDTFGNNTSGTDPFVSTVFGKDITENDIFENDNTGDETLGKDSFVELPIRLFFAVVSIVLCVIGVTSNIMTLLILVQNRRLMHLNLASLMTYLSLLNILNLLLGLLPIFSFVVRGVDIRMSHVYVCWTYTLVTTVFHMSDVWMAAFISVCRISYIFDCAWLRELRQSRLCTTLVSATVLVVVLVGLNLYFLRHGGRLVRNCGSPARQEVCHVTVQPQDAMYFMTVFSYTPGLVILVSSLTSVHTYVRATRRLSVDFRAKRSNDTKKLYFLGLTLTTSLHVVTIFPLSTSPLVNGDVSFQDSSQYSSTREIFICIGLLLMYANFAVNIQIYTLFSSRYRYQLFIKLNDWFPCLHISLKTPASAALSMMSFTAAPSLQGVKTMSGLQRPQYPPTANNVLTEVERTSSVGSAVTWKLPDDEEEEPSRPVSKVTFSDDLQ